MRCWAASGQGATPCWAWQAAAQELLRPFFQRKPSPVLPVRLCPKGPEGSVQTYGAGGAPAPPAAAPPASHPHAQGCFSRCPQGLPFPAALCWLTASWHRSPLPSFLLSISASGSSISPHTHTHSRLHLGSIDETCLAGVSSPGPARPPPWLWATPVSSSQPRLPFPAQALETVLLQGEGQGVLRSPIEHICWRVFMNEDEALPGQASSTAQSWEGRAAAPPTGRSPEADS